MPLIQPGHKKTRLMVPDNVKSMMPTMRGLGAEPSAYAKHRTSTDDFVTPEQVAEQVSAFMGYADVLPQAAGWTVMVLMLTIPDVTDGGIIMDDDYKALRTKASPQGLVVGIGAAAYREDDSRFRNGPWCKIGDRVLYGRYAGKPFQLSNGQELAFLSDTDIIATVESGWLNVKEDEDATS